MLLNVSVNIISKRKPANLSSCLSAIKILLALEHEAMSQFQKVMQINEKTGQTFSSSFECFLNETRVNCVLMQQSNVFHSEFAFEEYTVDVAFNRTFAEQHSRCC